MHVSSPNTPATFDPGLGPVRDKFRAGFENQIVAIEAWKKEIRVRNSQQAMAQISTRVHKIAGVAETLGFQRIGSVACSLEQVISAEGETSSTPTEMLDHAEVQLEELLDGLEAELD